MQDRAGHRRPEAGQLGKEEDLESDPYDLAQPDQDGCDPRPMVPVGASMNDARAPVRRLQIPYPVNSEPEPETDPQHQPGNHPAVDQGQRIEPISGRCHSLPTLTERQSDPSCECADPEKDQQPKRDQHREWSCVGMTRVTVSVIDASFHLAPSSAVGSWPPGANVTSAVDVRQAQPAIRALPAWPAPPE